MRLMNYLNGMDDYKRWADYLESIKKSPILVSEKHSKGSNLIKLFAKTPEEAYTESIEIIYDVFRYGNIDLEIESNANGDYNFYDRDMTLLAKMRKQNDKYVIYTITE